MVSKTYKSIIWKDQGEENKGDKYAINDQSPKGECTYQDSYQEYAYFL